MDGVDVDGRGRRERDGYLQTAIDNYVFIVIVYFLKPAWPWSREKLKDILDHDSRMVKSELGVLFLLPLRLIDSVRRVKVRRIVSGTWYSQVRALAAILCLVSICCSRPVVAGWYPYGSTT